MMTDQDRFMLAVRNLHRQKSTAHGPAWKRRGELISIMANLARKADRIGSAMRAPTPAKTRRDHHGHRCRPVHIHDQVLTFPADQDPLVAASLPPSQSFASGLSDGISGFDHLLAATAVSDRPESASVDTQHAAASVLSAFAQLEQCFDNTGPTCSPTARTIRAEALRAASCRRRQLINALRQEAPDSFELFVLTWSE